MNKTVYVIVWCTALLIQSAQAGINFGSRDSGFVLSGSTLELEAAVLSGGMIRDLTGNSLSGEATSCTDMTFELVNPATSDVRILNLNGVLSPGTSVTLGNDKKLTLTGGRILESIVVEGSASHPSIIEGSADFSSPIMVAANAKVVVRLLGACNQDIELYADTSSDVSAALLAQDLLFQPLYFFRPYGEGECTIDCGGYRLVCGGVESTPLLLNHNCSFRNPYIELVGPILIDSFTRIYIDGGIVDGSRNPLTFEDTTSSITNGENNITIKNMVLRNVRSNSLLGVGSWNFIETRIESSAYELDVATGLGDDFFTIMVSENSLDLTGMVGSDASSLFCGSTEIESTSVAFASISPSTLQVSLNKDLSLNSTWLFNDSPVIKGNGFHIMFNRVTAQLPEIEGVSVVRAGSYIFGSASITFEKVTLKNVVPDAFQTWNGNMLYVSDVNWIDAAGRHVFMTGLTETAAAIELPGESATAGDLFGNAIIFRNGVHIELQSDITLVSSWTFNEDSVIDGKGAIFDVTEAEFAVTSGKTLTLRNMTLKGATTQLFNTGATIALSNITIILASDTTWLSNIFVTGPLTVVTDDKFLAANNMVIEHGTAYYDTLGSVDANNFTVDSGRVMHIHDADTKGTITVNGNTWLDKNEYLFPNMQGSEGRIITCIGSGVLNGCGRSLEFPQTHGLGAGAGVVISVDAEKKLVTTNMIIDRLVPSEHLAVSGALYFGHDTIIRLNQDIQLSDVLRFGSNDSAVTNEYMELDLEGHTLNLGGSQGIQLYGATGGNNMLVIKNGRIIINSSNQILIHNAQNELVLDDVEIVLNSCNWHHENGWLTIAGNCKISGSAGSALIMFSDDYMEIRSLATLTLGDSIVYSHMSDVNLVFAAATSTLELIGATVRHPNYRSIESANTLLTLSTGKIVADHKSYFQPGIAGIALDDSLTIELRPGATIIVGTHGTEDLQDTSAGTLTYGTAGDV
jgi:hypothetical protein